MKHLCFFLMLLISSLTWAEEYVPFSDESYCAGYGKRDGTELSKIVYSQMTYHLARAYTTFQEWNTLRSESRCTDRDTYFAEVERMTKAHSSASIANKSSQ